MTDDTPRTKSIIRLDGRARALLSKFAKPHTHYEANKQPNGVITLTPLKVTRNIGQRPGTGIMSHSYKKGDHVVIKGNTLAWEVVGVDGDNLHLKSGNMGVRRTVQASEVRPWGSHVRG